MAPQDLWLKKDGTRSARYGRGKRWRVSYNDPHTGKAKNPSFARKVDAERFENNIKADISRGKYVDPALGRTTVGEYGDKYCKRLQARDSTRDNVSGRFRNHVEPVMGHLPMLAVRSGTIQDWIVNRQTKDKPLAASTIRTIYNSMLFPMFRRAVIDGLIPANPCLDIVLPELPEGEYDVPTPLQVAALADGIDDRYGAAVYLAAGCGIRTGEVFGLELEHVDFLRRKVRVRHQLLMSARGGPYLGPPKTRTSKRDIDLPTLTGDLLAQHVERFPPQEVLVWDRTNLNRPRQRMAKLLFVTPEGRPMGSARWSDILNAGIKEAGLPEGVYTMVSLRHFFATSLIYAGKNVKTVQMAMGHAKATVTLETYLGYWPEDERDNTREVIDAVFRKLAESRSDAGRTGSVPGATS